MLPHELIVWAMTTGRWSGPFSFCGAAEAEAPHEIDTSVMAAAARVRRTRMHDTLRRMTSERKYPDMWVDPEDDPREVESISRGEKAVLAEYLDHYRKTLEMKCDGLDAEQLARRSVPPSTMSLLGLVRHMAAVEHSWFQRQLQGKDEPRLSARTRTATPTSTGRSADPAVVEEAFATWRAQVRAAQEYLRRRRRPRCRPSTSTATRSRSATSWCTWSRSTPGTAATPTCSASASTAARASEAKLTGCRPPRTRF